MRRLLPLIITVVGLAALAVVIAPPSVRNPLNGQRIETKLGLDLKGGVRIEYRAMTPDQSAPRGDQLETIRTIIENRVNASGVAEPLVQTLGQDRVVVEMPGVENADELRKLIGSTGRLDFIPLPDNLSGDNAPVLEGADIRQVAPEATPLFSGDQVDSASVGQADPRSGGGPAVDFVLKPEGARLFEEHTRANVGKRFAIVLDNIIQSAPNINEAIPGGRGQISGSFTTSQVSALVTTLRFGALPLAVEEVRTDQINATLGEAFLRQSILGGAIGIALVFAFMLIHYRLPGAVACAALVYYAIVVFALFRLIPVTLTLAGIAAFVLSVGMAVDANILIFERTKEELRAGKTIQAAIEAGFNRAWNSFLDSNVSSLITAFILLYFGSAVIRGFALVLIIGVLVSMFTAITLSRMMLRVVVRQRWARQARLYGVQETEFTVATPRGRSREAGARV